MEVAQIKEALATTNIIAQPNTYIKVASFLQNQMGIGKQGTVNQILAAFSIICQVQKIKSVDNSGEVSTGIRLESIMKHLGKYSKETLLQEVIRQSEKWRETPLCLKSKIDQVNLAYRIYKKYRTLFQDLSKKYTQIDEQFQINMMSIFWVVYLFIKNTTHNNASNTLECTKILKCLFKFVFTEVLALMGQVQLQQAFEKQFNTNEPVLPSKYQNYKMKIMEILSRIHKQERGVDNFDLQKMLKYQHIMIRFLDDIDNNYSKSKAHSTIDQLSFNQLQKIIAPQSTKLTCQQSQEIAISQKIKFDSDSDQDRGNDSDHSQEQDNNDRDKYSAMEVQNKQTRKYLYNKNQDTNEANQYKNTQYKNNTLMRVNLKPISPIRSINTNILFRMGTPITLRNENLSWVQRITKIDQYKNKAQLSSIFQDFLFISYNDYEEQILKKIQKSIEYFTQSCQDKQNRRNSIYLVFAQIVLFISKHYQVEREKIFSKKSNFDSLLCLANNLFNYANQSLQSSHLSYCEIYQTGIITSLISLNLFGANKEIPKNIQLYIHEVQKRIILQQLWQSNQGYKWFINGCSGFMGQTIFKRLKMHTDYRTQQLCQVMKIQHKQSEKVINLMRLILEQRHLLLRDHNIDQIIICAITSIISINRSKTLSLQETFENYNKLLYSLSMNNNIFYDRAGQRIDILSYYNDVFLPQIEEIVKNERNNILCTPVRLEVRRKSSVTLELKQFTCEKFVNKKVKTDELYRTKYFFHLSRVIKELRSLDIKDMAVEENPYTS